MQCSFSAAVYAKEKEKPCYIVNFSHFLFVANHKFASRCFNNSIHTLTDTIVQYGSDMTTRAETRNSSKSIKILYKCEKLKGIIKPSFQIPCTTLPLQIHVIIVNSSQPTYQQVYLQWPMNCSSLKKINKKSVSCGDASNPVTC